MMRSGITDHRAYGCSGWALLGSRLLDVAYELLEENSVSGEQDEDAFELGNEETEKKSAAARR